MKNELKNKLLTKEQVDVVKEMIIDSMKSVYIDQGINPGEAFHIVSGGIADKIIVNSQKALIQTNVLLKQSKIANL
jgi:uncharacterized protein YqfA (UPF0365 family)